MHENWQVDDPVDEAMNAVAVATGRWTPEATQRDKARAQVLWMVDQARRSAKDGRAADARWWRNGAMCALWNVN